jgi:hypothetical protein
MAENGGCDVANVLLSIPVVVCSEFKQLYWLLGRKSPLSLENEVLVYKVAIKPIWTYGIELCGCASNSSTAILQRCQSKILRSMADAPRYVSNSTLHNDLGIPFIKDVLQERSTKHHDRLEVHPNTLLQPLLEKQNNRMLKRRLPIDLKRSRRGLFAGGTLILPLEGLIILVQISP